MTALAVPALRVWLSTSQASATQSSSVDESRHEPHREARLSTTAESSEPAASLAAATEEGPEQARPSVTLEAARRLAAPRERARTLAVEVPSPAAVEVEQAPAASTPSTPPVAPVRAASSTATPRAGTLTLEEF